MTLRTHFRSGEVRCLSPNRYLLSQAVCPTAPNHPERLFYAPDTLCIHTCQSYCPKRLDYALNRAAGYFRITTSLSSERSTRATSRQARISSVLGTCGRQGSTACRRQVATWAGGWSESTVTPGPAHLGIWTVYDRAPVFNRRESGLKYVTRSRLNGSIASSCFML